MIKTFKILLFLAFINPNTYSQEYNFTVSGHLYGSPESINQSYPAESLLANTGFIKSFNSNFFISLGDNCQNGNDSLSLKIFEESFTKNIKIPVFTAYGNHDGDRKSIEKRIGKKTFYSFEFNKDLFIFLDSELNSKDLNGICLNFMINILKDSGQKSNLNNIFIFSHKLMWATMDSKFKIITSNSNDPKYDYNRYNYFTLKIRHLINKLAIQKNIFWMAGDIGANQSLPLFYGKLKRLHVIATGLGDRPNDLILNIKVSNKKVGISGYNLLKHNGENLREYDIVHWREHLKKSKVLKRKIQKLLDRNFYLGVGLGVFSTIILFLSVKNF
jgi:hypothetical protein